MIKPLTDKAYPYSRRYKWSLIFALALQCTLEIDVIVTVVYCTMLLPPFESDDLGCWVLLSVRNVLTVIVSAFTVSHVSFHCILHCIRSLLKSLTCRDCCAREVISLYLRKPEHCSGTIIFGVRSRWCVPAEKRKKKEKCTHKMLVQWNRTCWTWRRLENSSDIVGDSIHEMQIFQYNVQTVRY